MPDFGIFRGFNEKLFGDKLYAGQLPIHLGMIAWDFVDPDAQAFFDRVTAAGGTLSNTEKLAVDTLVKQMKLDGIWTKMKAIYPMVGASAAACAQNLKSSSFTGTFTSGWTFASTGVTGNGTSAYMDTNLNASSILTNNNTHLSFYSRTQDTSLNAIDMGCYQPGTGEMVLTHYYNAVSEKAFGAYVYPAEAARSSVSNTLGLAIGTRTSLNNAKLYFTGSLLNTNTATITNSIPSASIAIGSSFRSDTLGPQQNSNRECAFASIGNGLTDTEAANLYTAVQAFQTTLSRQV